jgi:PHD/YefM family antitoxin component YafN of YafNO toxin-antitoxin module
MKNITANELKTRGISSIEGVIQEHGEAIITVRGQERYVVMDMEAYNHLRVCELEAALYETRQEIERGEYVEEAVDDHVARIVKGPE